MADALVLATERDNPDAIVDIATGKVTPVGKAAIIESARMSPNGQDFIVTYEHRPFSYLYPARQFPKEIEIWDSDPAAALLAHHRFSGTNLAPQVAAPHSPANTGPVTNFRQKVNFAYIGACTGAKLEDLRMAALVLKGRKSRVKLMVAPASLRDQQTAAREGTLGILLDAGAELLANSCGMCAGYGPNLLDDDTVAISSTARNFKGRMGSAAAQVYLASPYTVAASAVAGHIADPRDLLA